MKILRISGRNLASLAGDFEVDFEAAPLAEAGLFAICGPTGAGKSSLLDALCLALYGATPRMGRNKAAPVIPDVDKDSVNSTDPRTLLRRGCAEGWAQVDFIGHDRQRYRARWTVRRAYGKPGQKLQAAVPSLWKLPGEEPIGGKPTETQAAIIERIGLSFEQFTRAVLLAQNEFSAFLKTDENERGELLETLTGSDLYSDLSRRAHQRSKLEQDATRALEARLQDQAPLPDAERVLLVEDLAASARLLEQRTQAAAVAEQQVRWHDTRTALAGQVTQAEEALSAAQAEYDSAASRRDRIALIQNLIPTRPMLADSRRLGTEASRLGALVSERAAAAELARQAAQLAEAALQTAHRGLEQATRARDTHGPLLDQARQLDASLAALEVPLAQALAALQQADTQLAEASTALQAQQQQAGELSRQRAALAGWLDARAPWRAVAATWPRCGAMLEQAASFLNERTAAAQAHAEAEAAALTAAHALAAVETQVAALDATLSKAIQSRDQAAEQVRAFDREALATARRQLDQARALAQATAAQLAEHAQLTDRDHALRTLQQTLELAQTRAHEEQALAAALCAQVSGELAQAERTHTRLERECDDRVAALRAALEPGHPCPVCGSAEHPYHSTDATLTRLLQDARADLADARQRLRDAEARRADAAARAASAADQLEVAAADRAGLADRLAEWAKGWAELPLPAAMKPEPARAWLEAERARLDQLQATLEQGELDANAAARTLELAQHQLDLHASERQRLDQAIRGAGEQASSSAARVQAVAAQAKAATDRLGDLLDQVEHHWQGLEAVTDWRDDWLAAPEACHARWSASVAEWSAQEAALGRADERLAHLQVTTQAASDTRIKVDAMQRQRKEEADRLQAQVSGLRVQRAGLLGGEPTQAVERRLAVAVDTARQHHDQARHEREHATLAATRAAAALDESRHALTASAEAREACDDALLAWLEAFNRDWPAWLADRATGRTRDPFRLTPGTGGQARNALATASALAVSPDAASARSGSQPASRGGAAAARHALSQTGDLFDSLLAPDSSVGDADPQTADAPLTTPGMAPATAGRPGAAVKSDQAGATIPDLQALAELADTPDSWIDSERAALDLLDRQAANARTVLGERQRQLNQHLASASSAPATATEARDTLDSARLLQAESATQHSALALRLGEDDSRRTRSASLLAELERQRAVQLRWSRLDELIGSADGKKFRNYAQQYTLDVLLGYANRHLAQLARRYRIERIVSPTGPSLGLLVRDQDMGGEIRSVNSLSGGESFLVSLALALGLASLSSNRVRVESLFIDEGFGSLDSETLRVAMDALDALQSLGRKVGVISHVHDMTERIGTRIRVQPCGGGASRLTVEQGAG